MKSYREQTHNVIFDILPNLREGDYDFVHDQFFDYTEEDFIPAPVQALLKITNNGELFVDLDYALKEAEGGADRTTVGQEAIYLLEHLKDRITDTFYKPFASKIVKNCDKAIEMIHNREFKEGVIKPVSVEELESQRIKAMPKTDRELEIEYYKENKIPDPTKYSNQGDIETPSGYTPIRFSLASADKLSNADRIFVERDSKESFDLVDEKIKELTNKGKVTEFTEKEINEIADRMNLEFPDKQSANILKAILRKAIGEENITFDINGNTIYAYICSPKLG